MNYKQRRQLDCQDLFEGFEPDVSKSKNPDEILLVCKLASNGLYSHEIAKKIGKTPKAVQKIFRRYNFPDLHNFSPPIEHERPNWKGGVKIVQGYAYKRSPGHPYASKHGNYVAVHRLVMENKLGRFLLPTEVVDHIDGDISNNSPANLRVFASNAEHLRVTLKGKCPKWSKEGKEALAIARSQPRRTWKGKQRLPNSD